MNEYLIVAAVAWWAMVIWLLWKRFWRTVKWLLVMGMCFGLGLYIGGMEPRLAPVFWWVYGPLLTLTPVYWIVRDLIGLGEAKT